TEGILSSCRLSFRRPAVLHDLASQRMAGAGRLKLHSRLCVSAAAKFKVNSARANGPVWQGFFAGQTPCRTPPSRVAPVGRVAIGAAALGLSGLDAGQPPPFFRYLCCQAK